MPSSLWPAILQKMQRWPTLDLEALESDITRTSRTGATGALPKHNRIFFSDGSAHLFIERVVLTFVFSILTFVCCAVRSRLSPSRVSHSRVFAAPILSCSRIVKPLAQCTDELNETYTNLIRPFPPLFRFWKSGVGRAGMQNNKQMCASFFLRVMSDQERGGGDGEDEVLILRHLADT